MAISGLVPWWGWLLLAVVAGLLGRALAGPHFSPRASFAELLILNYARALGSLFSFFAMVMFVLLAALSAVTRAVAHSRIAESERTEPVLHPPSTGSSIAVETDLYKEWKQVGQETPPESIDTTSWNLGLLRALEWKRFEQLSALYFRALKFSVEEADFGPDGGVDLPLFAEPNHSADIVVQCKAWNSWKVGVKEVRALLGIMSKERINEGILITTSSFTDDAVIYARDTSLTLIDGGDLLKKLFDLPAEDQGQSLKAITSGDFTTPTCPSCGIKMLRRTGNKSGDSFWGCARYPSCRRTMQFSANARSLAD